MKRVHFKYWLRKERLIEHFAVCTQDGVDLRWFLSLDRAEKLELFDNSDKRSFKPICGPTLQAVVYCDPEGLCSSRWVKLCLCNVPCIENSMNHRTFSLKQTTPNSSSVWQRRRICVRECATTATTNSCHVSAVSLSIYTKCPLKT